MKCTRPTKFPNSSTHVTCGQCMACRITRRTEWQTKLMLEWQTFKQGCFVTLTYNNDHLPEKDKYKGGSLEKKDLQDFLKRFRKNYSTKYGYTKVRYFGVGEYGERFHRAHYHILLFNVDYHHAEETIRRSWKKGIVQIDPIHKNRLKYTVGYTIKKMTNEKDFEDGRSPEFSIMSKNPTLGSYALDKFAEILRKRKLYPSRSLSNYQTWILEQEGIEVGTWNGIYIQDDEYYRLDRGLMNKLADKAYPEIKQLTDQREEIFYPKEFKARQNRLHDNSYFDTIKFVTSEECDNEKRKAERQKRKTKKNTF